MIRSYQLDKERKVFDTKTLSVTFSIFIGNFKVRVGPSKLSSASLLCRQLNVWLFVVRFTNFAIKLSKTFFHYCEERIKAFNQHSGKYLITVACFLTHDT